MAQNTIRIMSFFKRKNLSARERNPYFFVVIRRKKNMFSPKKNINRLRQQAGLTQRHASVTLESFLVFARLFPHFPIFFIKPIKKVERYA